MTGYVCSLLTRRQCSSLLHATAKSDRSLVCHLSTVSLRADKSLTCITDGLLALHPIGAQRIYTLPILHNLHTTTS